MRIRTLLRRPNRAQRPAGSAHQQLAAGIDTHIHACQRRASGSRAGIAWAGQRDHRPRFGQPISLHQRHSSGGKHGHRPFPQGGPARHTDPHPPPQSCRQIGDSPRLHSPLQPLEKCRNAEDHRGRELLAGLQDSAPFADNMEAAAPHQSRIEITGAGQSMAQGQPGKPHVGRLVEKHFRGSRGIECQGPLAVAHAVRPPGGARGDDHRRARAGIAGLESPLHLGGEPRDIAQPSLPAGASQARLREALILPHVEHPQP